MLDLEVMLAYTLDSHETGRIHLTQVFPEDRTSRQLSADHQLVRGDGTIVIRERYVPPDGATVTVGANLLPPRALTTSYDCVFQLARLAKGTLSWKVVEASSA